MMDLTDRGVKLMNVLLLGADSATLLLRSLYASSDIAHYFTDCPQDVSGYDWLISFGLRSILPPEILSKFDGRTANLHISYLPWNKGADPNFWSWVDDTPKGVTIHRMTKGLDCGPIYAQREIQFGDSETLRTSYHRLTDEIIHLFSAVWPSMRDGLEPTPQNGRGTYHRSADKDDLWLKLPLGYDTPCSEIIRLARADRSILLLRD